MTMPQPRWLRSPWLILALCVAAILPLVFPHYIGTLDLAGHTGRYALELDEGRSADLARWYSYKWDFIPNLGVDVIMLFLGRHMEFFRAVKVAVMVIPVVHVLGMTLTSRAVHGYVTPTALFALPLAFCYFFHFGFANFCLGLGTAFCAFALWRYLGDRRQVRARAILFVGVSSLVWLVHLTSWGLLCVLCGSDELVRCLSAERNRIKALVLTGLRLLVLFSPFVIKLALFTPAGGGGGGEPNPIGHFFEWEDKAALFAFVLRDRWIVWDLGSMVLLVALYAYCARSRRFALDPALLLATVLLAILYILLPYEMGGSVYADMRLAPMLFMTALLSIRPAPLMGRRAVSALAVVALLFVGARFAGNAVSLALWDQQFRKDLTTLDAVPRGSSMITITAMECGADMPWNRDRRAHLSGLAIPLRHVFDNNQFASVSGQLIRSHNPDAGPFQGSPSGEARARDCHPGDAWYHKLPQIPATIRYLWLVGIDRRDPIAGWTLIRDTGSVQLYHR